MSAKTKAVAFKIPIKYYEVLKKEANLEGRSTSNLINRILQLVIDKRQYERKGEKNKIQIPDNIQTLYDPELAQKLEEASNEYETEKASGHKHKTFSSNQDLINYLNKSNRGA